MKGKTIVGCGRNSLARTRSVALIAADRVIHHEIRRVLLETNELIHDVAPIHFLIYKTVLELLGFRDDFFEAAQRFQMLLRSRQCSHVLSCCNVIGVRSAHNA